MHRLPITTAALTALAAFALGGPAVAQELSDAEIIARLQAQQEIVQGLGAARSLGEERGFTEIVLDEPAPPEGGTVAVAAAGPEVYRDFGADTDVDLRIRFAFESATLLPEEGPRLERLCGVLKASGIGRFAIYGHTDASGGDDYNQRLSQLRAEEVERYLAGPCGLPADALEARGLGERVPLEGADPAAPDNRRVEVQALS